MTRIQFNADIDFNDGRPAAGVHVTVSETFGGTSDFGDANQDGRVSGQLRERNGFLDQPSFTVTITDDLAHTFTTMPIAWFLMNDVRINLPNDFTNTQSPTPVVHLLRRKNLSTDFTVNQQRQLADLVYSYLGDGLIELHMEQIDHVDNFYTDHRTYIYEIEKRLLRDGYPEYVPLPVWEPLFNIPEHWELVRQMEDHPPLPPLAPYNLLALDFRPQIPNRLRPENICGSGFNTAQSVAIELGRTATSAPGSFHFNTHAALAGPFFEMHTAAAAVIFWPLHALFVDIYDKWLSCTFAFASPRTVNGRNSDGRLEVFRIDPMRKLWHSYQRLAIVHRDELDRVVEPPNVPAFVHWSHWERLGADKDVADIKVFNDNAGQIVLLAKGQDNRLYMMRQTGAGWSEWIDLDTDCVDFSAALNLNGTLEVVVTRPKTIRRGSAFVVAFRTEKAQGSSDFFPWGEMTGLYHYHRIEAIQGGDGTPHVFVSTNVGELFHLWKRPNGTWTPTQRKVGDEYFRIFRVARNEDGRLELFGLKNSDECIYHRWVNSAQTPVDWRAASTWSEWERLNQSYRFYDFTVARNEDGRLEVFALDRQFGRAWHVWQMAPNSSWSNWAEIPLVDVMGHHPRNISAGLDYEDRLTVFVDDNMHFTCNAHQRTKNAGPWIGWTNI